MDVESITALHHLHLHFALCTFFPTFLFPYSADLSIHFCAKQAITNKSNWLDGSVQQCLACCAALNATLALSHCHLLTCTHYYRAPLMHFIVFFHALFDWTTARRLSVRAVVCQAFLHISTTHSSFHPL